MERLVILRKNNHFTFPRDLRKELENLVGKEIEGFRIICNCPEKITMEPVFKEK
jgi:hypothetical protein